MNAEVLLQVVFVLEGFSTFAAFELAVSSSFVQQRRLQTKIQNWSCDGGRVGSALRQRGADAHQGNLIVFSGADVIDVREKHCGLRVRAGGGKASD